VRASTGSFFAVPIVEVENGDVLRAWATARGVTLVATDEAGDASIDELPSPPVAYLFGNETAGLSRALRLSADLTVAIPMQGTASSLNIAAAHAIVLFTATRRG
jgi:TrmH family RNA methyltransferase